MANLAKSEMTIQECKAGVQVRDQMVEKNAIGIDRPALPSGYHAANGRFEVVLVFDHRFGCDGAL